MKKFLFVLLLVVPFLFSCKADTTEIDSRADTDEIAVTGDSADVGETSATLYGWSNQDGSAGASVVFGIEYSATDLTTAAISVTASEKDAENKYLCRITGLTYNTLYYYRAFTLYNGSRTYGEVKTFTTRDFSATVTTLPASDIADFRATFNGTLSMDSVNDLDRSVWFLYSDSATTLESLKSSGNRVNATLSEDGSFQNVVSLLNYNTIYYYVACSRVWDRDIYGKIKIFTTEPCSEVVDLGLSVKWRGWNLGAYRPEEYGDYFAWGETEPKSYYDYTNYKWCNGSETTLTKYNDNSYYGSVDSITELQRGEKSDETIDDAARAKLGGKWRMPTESEWTALIGQCTWTWTTQNSVDGCLVTANNGNSIFLPAAGYRIDTDLKDAGSYGYYWSSSLYHIPMYAERASFNSRPDNIRIMYLSLRITGLSVRPVYEE